MERDRILPDERGDAVLELASGVERDPAARRQRVELLAEGRGKRRLDPRDDVGGRGVGS
jgi:hypothetical protein